MVVGTRAFFPAGAPVQSPGICFRAAAREAAGGAGGGWGDEEVAASVDGSGADEGRQDNTLLKYIS